MRSLQELAAEALRVQDACNVCALASGMHRALCDLLAHARAQGLGTHWVNTHHITRLWTDKIESLVDTNTIVNTQSLYWCQQMSEGINPEGAVDDLAIAIMAV